MIVKLNDITVELTESLLDKIEKFTQDINKCESGGILLGGFIPKEKRYVITEVTVPNETDLSSPTYFVRNYKSAQIIIEKCWTESSGKINYLGEWHTHGCINPKPSFTDRKLLKMIISDESNVWDEVFMLILGQDNTIYLGMTNVQSKGKIIAEIIIRRDVNAHIYN